jgi:hypothetical protein
MLTEAQIKLLLSSNSSVKELFSNGKAFVTSMSVNASFDLWAVCESNLLNCNTNMNENILSIAILYFDESHY